MRLQWSILGVATCPKGEECHVLYLQRYLRGHCPVPVDTGTRAKQGVAIFAPQPLLSSRKPSQASRSLPHRRLARQTRITRNSAVQCTIFPLARRASTALCCRSSHAALDCALARDLFYEWHFVGFIAAARFEAAEINEIYTCSVPFCRPLPLGSARVSERNFVCE